jgi:hypothetical protein
VASNGARRLPLIAAAATFVAFAAFSLWRWFTGGQVVDHLALHFTNSVLHGWFDRFVSSLWPLGEPQLGGILTASVAAVLLVRGRWKGALTVLLFFAVLTGGELGMRAVEGAVSGVGLGKDALVHSYPSGHTARVPLIGGMITALAPARWRAWAAALTVLVAILVAMDRTDSTLQTGSDVVGGLLLGTWLAFAFAAIRR